MWQAASTKIGGVVSIACRINQTLDGIADLKELVEGGWLLDIAVGAKLSSLATVSRRIGGSDYGDRHARQGGYAPYAGENLAAVDAREIEIEEHDVGRVERARFDKLDGLFAIVEPFHFEIDTIGAEGLLDQIDIGGVVFNQQYLHSSCMIVGQ